MKKIFSLFAAVLFAGSMMAADEVLFSQTYPGSPSKYTNNYTGSFTMTTSDYTLTYANINNGQESNKWTSVRAGRKSYASTATVTTGSIATPITKVSINFTAIKAAKTNELYLLVASDADFTSPTKISQTIAAGTIDFVVTAPAANQYYRIVIDMAAESSSGSNGFNQFDSIAFCKHKEVAVEAPVIAGDADFFEEVNVTITSATEGASIYYTTDGTTPTASSTLYGGAFKLTESKPIKAIAIKGDDASEVTTKVFTAHPVFASIEDLVTADLESGSLVKVSFADVKITSIATISGGAKKGIYVNVKDKNDSDVEIYYASDVVPDAWVVDGEVSGTVVATWTLYKTTYEIVPAAGFEWTNLTYKAPSPTAIDNNAVEAKAVKTIKNGQLLIEKNGVVYNVLGEVVR